MILHEGLEEQQLRTYHRRAESETPLCTWWLRYQPDATLFVAQGFEERGLGVLRCLSTSGISIPRVVLGRYKAGTDDNERFRNEFVELAYRVGKNVVELEGVEDGSWVRKEIKATQTRITILDISALSNRALFPALDALHESLLPAALVYSEASSYWPSKENWQDFKHRLGLQSKTTFVGSEFDFEPMLYGGEHRVIVAPKHEGYDTPGAKLALLTFLPFKAARLGALMSWSGYARYILVEGRPRLKRNSWRLDVLREINEKLVLNKEVIELSTFGYLDCLGGLVDHLYNYGILEQYTLHLSPIGSKLQNVATWILSTMLPDLTVIISVPNTYYSEAFSRGVGRSWAFHLLRPDEIKVELADV